MENKKNTKSGTSRGGSWGRWKAISSRSSSSSSVRIYFLGYHRRPHCPLSVEVVTERVQTCARSWHGRRAWLSWGRKTTSGGEKRGFALEWCPH